ncbi:MFS transporter [Actinocorallia longicatena]
MPQERKGGTLVAVLSLAAMVVSLMQTQAVPILGLIAGKLGTSAANAGWVTTATLLSAAVMTPLLGRVGDQFGKKRTLLAVLALAVAGSAVAAVAGSLWLLLAGRALQGAATAIFPLALSILREELPPAKLHGAMAVVSGTLAFGSGLGLVVTGLLTQGTDPDYRIVFWFSTVVAAIALGLVAARVPATGHRGGGRIDLLGALTLGGFLVLLLLPLSQGNAWGWTSAATLGCFAASALVAALWVAVERRVAAPLVDLAMFTHRPVLFTNLAGMFVGFAMFVQFLGVSYLAQMPEFTGYGFGASVLRASLEFLLPGTIASMLAAPLGGMLVGRSGPRHTLVVSSGIGLMGYLWLIAAHGTPFSVIVAGILVGVSVSFAYASMPALIAASVPHHQSGVANGINSISRTVGSSLASAIFTTLLTSNTLKNLPPGAPELPAESGFTTAFVIAAVAYAITAAVALFGLRPAHAPAGLRGEAVKEPAAV